jgi:hypothetical protein
VRETEKVTADVDTKADTIISPDLAIAARRTAATTKMYGRYRLCVFVATLKLMVSTFEKIFWIDLIRNSGSLLRLVILPCVGVGFQESFSK